MPFTGITDPDLPDNIKKLSAEKRKQWVGAWNGSFADCHKKGAGDCEGKAFRIANAAIKEADMGEQNKDSGLGVAPEADTEAQSEAQDGEKTCEICGTKFCGHAVEQYHPFAGATTFEEIDALEKAREQAGAVSELSFQAESLMRNVMRSEEVTDKPGALVKIANGLRSRLGQAVTKAIDAVVKQATKTEDGIAFKPSDFAVVPDKEKPTDWKLRLAEGSSGNFTVTQVAAAITAMQPGGFRGNKVQLEAGDKKQAISRIRAAIGKISGATYVQKGKLTERLDKVKEVGMLPFQTFKDASGGLRWFAVVSNNFRDMDNPPEIFEGKAHTEFISYLDGGGTYPELWLWHTPGTKCGVADWADYDQGFLMMSGPVDEGKEAIVKALSEQPDIGVSHGYRFKYSDRAKGIIGRYRTFEVSPLPLIKAANPWTSLSIIMKEAKSMNEEKRTFLVGLLGEDEVAKVEVGLSDLNKTLTAAGVEQKDLLGEEVPAPSTDVMAQAMVKALEESEGLKAISATLEEVKAKAALVPGIVERLDALEKTDDAKVATILRGKSSEKGYRASTDVDNVAKDGDPAKEAAEKQDNGWFSEVVAGAVKGMTGPDNGS